MTSLLVFLSCLQSQHVVAGRPVLTSHFVSRETGTLNAKVVIVEELSQYPVAFSDFDVIGPDPGTVQSVRTNGDGQLNLELVPGLYAFASHTPVSFKGKTYTWSTSFEIERSKRTTLTLTHSDATVEKNAPLEVTREKISPESKIYRQFQSSVVTVECDGGSGSGFVIDAQKGLLLTTYHVAGNSNFLSVRFARQHHYEAKFVAGDPQSDAAIIRVNPEVLKNVASIPLKNTRHVGIEGERVVAMGSPLYQQTTITQGIISKVEDDALMSDVSLSRGTSGGPILNLEGEAIGIATFGDAVQPGGPGATGIVSIRKVDRLLGSIGVLDSSTMPSAEKLPDNSVVTIPPEMLERIALSIKGDEPYLKTPKNFRTYIKTPFDAHMNVARYKSFLKEKIARRYNGRVPDDQSIEMGPLYFWNKYVGNQFEPVVSIEVIPWPQETSGSFLTRLAGVATGNRMKERREMRDDFTKMTLIRNGVEVTPILRKRLRDTEIYDTRDLVMRDTALSGFYTYDPSVFAPGSKLELHVWKNAEAKPTVIRVPGDYQQRIWKQFQEWARMGG